MDPHRQDSHAPDLDASPSGSSGIPLPCLTQKNGASALGLRRVLVLKSYETAWTWLHKFRRAMVLPNIRNRRDHFPGHADAILHPDAAKPKKKPQAVGAT